jgi:hypothetical protein
MVVGEPFSKQIPPYQYLAPLVEYQPNPSTTVPFPLFFQLTSPTGNIPDSEMMDERDKVS